MSLDDTIKQNISYAYRIISHLNMDDHTYTHLSARSADREHYYIYPFGLCFSEVTEDNLLKVTLGGEIIEGKEFQYNKTGYIIHGNIYKNRDDIDSVFHLHTTASVAVSVMKKGLMPLSQWALHFYNRIAYHNYNSLALDNNIHGTELINDLANYKVMLMRSHGMLTCGETIMEALFYAYHLEMACQAQCLALQSRQELILPPESVCEQAVKDLLGFEKNLGERDFNAWIRKYNL